jgi:hypothetical protein
VHPSWRNLPQSASCWSTGSCIPHRAQQDPSCVASRDGDFARVVEFADNHYDATDARGARLASCGTLRQAQDRIEQSMR